MVSFLKLIIGIIFIVVLLNYPQIVPDGYGHKITLGSYISEHFDRWCNEMVYPKKNIESPKRNSYHRASTPATHYAAPTETPSISDSKPDWSQYRVQGGYGGGSTHY